MGAAKPAVPPLAIKSDETRQDKVPIRIIVGFTIFARRTPCRVRFRPEQVSQSGPQRNHVIFFLSLTYTMFIIKFSNLPHLSPSKKNTGRCSSARGVDCDLFGSILDLYSCIILENIDTESSEEGVAGILDARQTSAEEQLSSHL
jgi:hypothetical protein